VDRSYACRLQAEAVLKFGTSKREDAVPAPKDSSMERMNERAQSLMTQLVAWRPIR
jgi:hypothetical protein